jgi:hypothetical protein
VDARQSPEQLRTALGATASEIAKFAPEIETKLATLVPNAPLSPGEERLRLFDNTARSCARCGADGPASVHRRHPLGRPGHAVAPPLPVCAICATTGCWCCAAYREIELDRSHPLASALVEWNRERLATRVALGAACRAPTRARSCRRCSARKACPRTSRPRLYRGDRGNPVFQSRKSVKALIEQGQIYREQDRWERNGIA